MIVVTLKANELLSAAIAGVRRQVSALASGREDYCHNDSVDPFERHIMGAMTELAVAKTFNLFWADETGRVDGSDVGGIIEVRSRKIGGRGLDLGIRERGNKPNKPYLLVHCDVPKFFLIGWIYGGDGWAIGKENGLPGVRWVPAKIPPLRPVDELRAIVEQTARPFPGDFPMSEGR
jgi:hypothetical protein